MFVAERNRGDIWAIYVSFLAKREGARGREVLATVRFWLVD